MAKSRWQKWLDIVTPSTGRYRMESGETFNIADAMALIQREELSAQSLLGNAWAVSIRATLPSNGTIDYVLEVPTGVRVDLHVRTQTVVNGNVNFILLDNPDAGYVVAERYFGKNLDRENTTASLASIVRTEELTTGGDFFSEQVVYAEAQKNKKQASTTTGGDAIPSYTANTLPVLRVDNETSTQVEVIINVIWAEHDNSA